MSAQKNALRKNYVSLRERISVADRESKQLAISKSVLNLISDLKPEGSITIASYRAFRSEAKVYLESQDVEVVYPRVQGEDLKFYRGTSFEVSSWGIEEPVATSVECSPQEIDFVLVPGLAFDHNGQRLGYGRGFYDRWLLSHPTTSIGISFSEQMTVENLPAEKHDISLNYIVTENFCFNRVDLDNYKKRVS